MVFAVVWREEEGGLAWVGREQVREREERGGCRVVVEGCIGGDHIWAG